MSEQSKKVASFVLFLLLHAREDFSQGGYKAFCLPKGIIRADTDSDGAIRKSQRLVYQRGAMQTVADGDIVFFVQLVGNPFRLSDRRIKGDDGASRDRNQLQAA